MHDSVRFFVNREVANRELANRSVLEVGSLDVNGSLRDLFTGHYVGTDMREGPGVDVVCNAHELVGQFAPRRFEVIVCCEMLEHDDAPWKSVRQMRRIAARGATLLLTARGYDERGCFPLHDHPQDLWRYSREGLAALVKGAGWALGGVVSDPEAPGVFVVAKA